MSWSGVAAFALGLSGWVGIYFTWRRAGIDRRKARADRSEQLTALIVAQTENLLRGNEASVEELRERATQLLVELRDCRHERDGLRDRVTELEDTVATLQSKMAELDRRKYEP